MRYDDEELNHIYDKTDGYCYYCDKKLAFSNYGQKKRKRAWEVEHITPLWRGGFDSRRNRVPACIRCNRSKGDLTSREFRNKGKGFGGNHKSTGSLALGVLLLILWIIGQRNQSPQMR